MTTAETTTAIARRDDEHSELAPLSADNVKHQVQLIQQIQQAVMKDGTHYGTVPGCGDKPTLLKPGAEKLGMTFRIHPEFHVDRYELAGGHREYEIVCKLYNDHGGFVGEGLGVCSTMESKYRWRRAERKCPECGAAAIIKGKAEYGGGWLCWKKKEGCGAKFEGGDQAIEGQHEGKVENPDPADCYNTVKKIAKKRAHVDAILTATAASDIFAQDLEDLPKGDDTPQQPSQPPKNDPPQPPAEPASEEQLFTIRDLCAATDTIESDIAEWCQVDNIEAMSGTQAETVVQMLQKKYDRAQNSAADAGEGGDE